LQYSLNEESRYRIEMFDTLREQGLICQSGEFYPSVHYPPITMYKTSTDDALLASYQPPHNRLFSLYAHIPFCLKACAFCHYPVKFLSSDREMDGYVDTIIAELDLWRSRLGVERLATRSILIGGGTPTYLRPQLFRRFFEQLTGRLDLSRNTQFTVDVDPLTLIGDDGVERLSIMREFGVDRLTMGIQSLNDETLKRMNRHHDAAQALAGLHATHAAGFTNNIEFIFGYPGDTIEDWQAVIEQAVRLPVEEIQLYRLKMIPYGDRTAPISKNFKGLQARLPEVPEVITMKAVAHQILQDNGFNPNLTRVFSKEVRHYSHYAANQCCQLWDQIGIGQTAFSSLRDRFLLNTDDFKEYYASVRGGHLPANRGLVRTPEEQARWAVILPLKNMAVSKRTFTARTGMSLDSLFRPKIERLKAHGLLFENAHTLGLTPIGRFFADEICQQFESTRYIPFPREAYSDGPLNPYHDQDEPDSWGPPDSDGPQPAFDAGQPDLGVEAHAH